MLNDCRIAWRRLRGAPGFAAVAALTLALAIGANTAIFSIADAVLFKPLPYDDPESVFVVMMSDPQSGDRYTQVAYADLTLLAEQHSGLAGVGVFERTINLVISADGEVEVVFVSAASVDYFDLLGVSPARGRLFGPGDADSPGRPTLLTWSSFRQRFGGNESVIGRTTTLDKINYDIIGVLPPDFVFPTVRAARTELITVAQTQWLDERGAVFYPIVRLGAGVTVEQANAEIRGLTADRAGLADPDRRAIPTLQEVRSVLYPSGGPMMRFLLAASGLVLLIGCANLANMLLARTRLREKEIGVQAALGATRANLLRPLVIEAVMIGVIGAVGAVLMTTLAFDVLLRQVPPQAFGSAPVGVGPRVVLFALALGIAGGLIFAAAPAYRASRMDAQALLRGVGSRGATRGSLGSSMLVAQVALAIVLVFGAMIAARAFIDVLQVPLGFDPDGVVMARVAPDGRGGVGFQDFYRRAMEAIGDRTDVVSVGAVGSIPFGGGAPDEGVVDAETGAARAGIYHVLPGYFETAQIPLLRGHLPTWADIDGAADIAVIPESTARALFGSSEPIGATFSSNRGRRLTVVGIVGEVTHTLAGESRPQAYVIPGAATRGMWVVARVRNHNDQTLAALRRQLGAMRPGMPVTATWWSDSIGSVAAMRSPRFQTLVLGSFAALGLGLTALGVFGLVAFLVAHRMREMGIRLAIGATPNALVALSMRQSLLPAAVGVAIGLLATVWLSRVAESQLYEVNANDPATLTLAVISVVIAALVAAWFPARHAGRVDPMTVLRME